MFELIDMHMHLCRDVQQERTVFPKPGWPDEWYWCNGERISAHMDQHHISRILSVNVIDHHAMFERRIRLARQQGASDAEIERARVELADEMRHRVRDMNDWTLALHAREPRVDVYAAIDPVLFGDGAMAELERCLQMGAIGVKVHPPIYMHHPDHPVMMHVYERCQELGLGVLADTASRKSRDGVVYGEAVGWRPVLKTFPHLKLIQAHLCGDRWDDQLDLAREFPDNLFFDFSGGWVDETTLPPSTPRCPSPRLCARSARWGSRASCSPHPPGPARTTVWRRCVSCSNCRSPTMRRKRCS